jgi:hypothetical protein
MRAVATSGSSTFLVRHCLKRGGVLLIAHEELRIQQTPTGTVFRVAHFLRTMEGEGVWYFFKHD